MVLYILYPSYIPTYRLLGFVGFGLTPNLLFYFITFY